MGRMGRASRLDRSPSCTNRQRLRGLPISCRLSTDVEKELRMPVETGSTAVPNVLVVEDEMVLRMRAVDIVEDADLRRLSRERRRGDRHSGIPLGYRSVVHRYSDAGSMDGLKLAHAVHERWPAIKIILVSGQVKPSDAERPADSRFFGKPSGCRANDQRIAGDGGRRRVEDLPHGSDRPTGPLNRSFVTLGP